MRQQLICACAQSIFWDRYLRNEVRAGAYSVQRPRRICAGSRDPATLDGPGGGGPISVIPGCPRERSRLISRAGSAESLCNSKTSFDAFRKSVRCSISQAHESPGAFKSEQTLKAVVTRPMEMQMTIEDFDKYTRPTGARYLRHTNAIPTILITVPRSQQEAYRQLLADPLRWMDTVRFL